MRNFFRSTFRQIALPAASLVAALLPVIAQAATTYNIATTSMASAVDGQCTLVEALASASADATVNECVSAGGPYTINLVPGTYSFMTKTYVDGNFGDTAVNVSAADVTINGNGATLNRGSGADTMRLFYIANFRSLTLSNLTVSGFNASNTAQPVAFWGGAFAMLQGFLNIEDSTISGNVCQTTGCDGAAIVAYVSTVNIHRSTIANNDGTSINIAQIRMTQNSNLNIGNSTFYGPRIGVSTTNGSTTYISSSTMAGQSALIFDPGGVANVQNSLLFNDCSMNGGTVNLFNSAAPFNCGGTQPTYTLKAPAANGGLTLTRAILQGDFPQDKAPGCTYLSSPSNPLYTNGAPVTTDQRGAARDASCDLGAFELFSLSAITPFAAQVQVPYSAAVTATGAGPFTYAHTLGTLPPGLTLAANGTLSGTPTTANNYTFEITATDSNGNNSTRRYTNFPVSKGNQTLSFNAQAGQTYSPGGTFPVSPLATSTSGLAPAYVSLTPSVCTVSVATVTIVSAGTCTIRASQAGNVNFNPAAPVQQDVMISPANQTLTFGAQASQVLVAGGTFAINPLAAATSALAPVYSSTTPAVCAVTGTTVTMVGIVGTCTIAADQGGNGNYNAAPQVTSNVTITQGTQSIVFGAIANLPLGSGPLTLTPTASSGLAVSIVSQTPTVCTATGVNGSTITLIAIGTCTLNATQAGNSNYLAAAPVLRSFSVLQAGGSLSLRSSAVLAAYGAPLVLTAQTGGFNAGGTVSFTVGDSSGVVVLCSAAPVSNGTASCAVPGKYQKQTPVFFQAIYSGDINNLPSAASLQQQVDLNAVGLSAAASPAQPISGRPVTLRALVSARTFANGVTFYENGTALPGCANVSIAPLPGVADTGVASCTINAITTGSHNYVVTYPRTTGQAFEQTFVLNVVALTTIAQDYSDMWWAGSAENGWGMSVTQHGNAQFVVLYVYDAAGKPVWYAMPGGSWNAGMTAYSGALYLLTSAPLNAYDANQFKANASIGSLTITYTGASTATLNYTINGVAATKNVTRQSFGTDDGQPRLQVNDLWWAGSEQNGWGLNIAQQGRVLFPIWYTYDSSGKATWYAVPGGTWNGTGFTGDFYATTGSAWLGTSYNPAAFAATKVGTMSLNFLDQNTATMTYAFTSGPFAGTTQTKQITRQPY